MKIQTFGEHRITCASIEDPVIDKMLEGVMADLYFSDPPWGDGNMKFWTTMNKKMTGAEFKPLTYEELIERIFSIVDRHVDGQVMILTGVRWGEWLAERFEKKQFSNVRTIDLDYNGGRGYLPCTMVYGQTRPLPLPNLNPDAKHGYPCVKELVQATTEPGQKVIDLCCGMGYTAQACIDLGLTFYGNEFNEKRLQKTIRRFTK